VIEFRDVHFAYPGGAPLLEGISLRLEGGEHVGLVGSNGSGKSTLARLTNGLLLPSSGAVLVDGMQTSSLADLPAIRQKIGMVFQNPDNQIVGSIVEDDVAFGPENLALSTPEIEERVRWALEHTGLSELARRSPMALSGGQKQRLAVAGVLAMRPSHLVLDEATAMLDPRGRSELLEVARELRRVHGIAILQITHLLEELLAAERILALDRGKLVFDGPRASFFEEPALLAQLGLETPPLLAIYHQLRGAGAIGALESLDADSLAGAIALAAGGKA
jgi:energy-coupling factor transport system ATP-binding protein